MSDKSEIEWTDATWNPVRGCVKVSPGCKHCYAETFAERFRRVAGHPYEQGFDPRLVPEALSIPMQWRKGRRVFVNSMSDLFGEFVPDEYIATVFGVMASTRQHAYQVLTKRAERLPKWFAWLDQQAPAALNRWIVTVEAAERACGETIPGPRSLSAREDSGHAYRLHEAMKDALREDDSRGVRRALGSFAPWWPLSHVHLGVSVESAKYKYRIDHLRRTPAAVRFLSIEPLLEDLGELDLRGIHQVIVGCESGPGRRPMKDEWVRSIRDQALSAGCKFFYKQQIEGGKKVSLPLLDGRQWSETP